MLVSSQFKFTNVHGRADTHARGKLGRGDAALLPPVQEAHQGPSAAARLSRSPTGRTVGTAGAGGRRPWQRRAGPQGQTSGRCLSPQPAFRVESPSSQAWPRPAHPSRLSPYVFFQEPGLGSALTALGFVLPHNLCPHTRPLSAPGEEVWAPSFALDPDAASLSSSQHAAQEGLAPFHRRGH